jgi:hypothetical protein
MNGNDDVSKKLPLPLLLLILHERTESEKNEQIFPKQIVVLVRMVGSISNCSLEK